MPKVLNIVVAFTYDNVENFKYWQWYIDRSNARWEYFGERYFIFQKPYIMVFSNDLGD